ERGHSNSTVSGSLCLGVSGGGRKRKFAAPGASQVRGLPELERASCGAASESSPRREPWGREWCPPRAAERRKNRSSRLLLSPLPGLRIHYALSHGLRRGLLSDATPWLPCRRVFLLKT